MNHKEKLSGVFPPIITPFDGDEKVAYGRLAANIEKYNHTKLRGYMPLGSNGEFRALTDYESVKIVDTISKTKSPDKVLIAGAQRESAFATSEFIDKIADKGVDYATILAPHYFSGKMTVKALIAYYTTIADASPIPIMVYNAPKFSAQVTVPTAVIAELAPHENIAGMKDTSSADIAAYGAAIPQNAEFHVLAGSINKLYKSLVAGAVGGVISMANYLPVICCNVYKAWAEGNRSMAIQLDERARAISANAAGKWGVAGVKAAMDLLGYYGGSPRNPLMPLTENQKADLRAALIQEGLL